VSINQLTFFKLNGLIKLVHKGGKQWDA